MDNVLEKTRQAVGRYKSRSQSDSLNATKSVWAAVRFLRKQLADLERDDRGITTRVARDLSELLSRLPMFRYLAEEKEALSNLPGRKEAEDHILKLETELKVLVKELENSKIDDIRGWVENHPVLGTLTKTLTRKMPDTTYVFLFRQQKNETIELVTSRAPDGRVFTRFRPREFFDVKKLYRLYRNRPPVGAAVVVANKLQDVIGTVPQAGEGENQLNIISAMSREAASQPAKLFVSTNPVLTKLNVLVKERKIDKGAYVLLFVEAQDEPDFDEDLDSELSSEEAGVGHDDDETMARDEESASGEFPESESTGETATESVTDESVGNESVSSPIEHDEIANDESAATAELPASENVESESASTEEAPVSEDGSAEEVPVSEDAITESVENVDSGDSADSTADQSDSTPQEAESISEAIADESGTEPVEESQSGVETGDFPAIDLSSALHASEDAQQDGSSEVVSETGSDQQSVQEPVEDNGTASDTAEEASAAEEPEIEIPSGPVDILTRAGADGVVLTRFYANEFSDVRKMFESFGGQRTISGAAIIRGRELVNVIGNVPRPQEGRSQLDLLIQESNHAADKPTRDFLADNEVLDNLQKLAAGNFPDANAKVVLFVEEEGGRLATLAPPPAPQREERGAYDRNRGRGGRDDRGRGRDDRRGGRDNDRNRDDNRGGARRPMSNTSMLTDFKFPREIRNNYRNKPRVVGASVIGEFKAPQPANKQGGGKEDERGSDRDRGRKDFRRNESRPPSKMVVLAAFGRTPLKQHVLITEETTRKLGLDPIN